MSSGGAQPRTRGTTNRSATARERVRAELTREITEVARGQLATDGAVGLSLRAVAREMGMVSSAVYRYFPSKDDLLTALIIDGYNALGDAVETAERTCARDDYAGRWLAVCRTVRDWALARPHEYALLYGSPVPGYQAPRDTVGPAMRDTVVYGRIISDAHAAGVLETPAARPPVPPALADDLGRVREVMPGAPDDLVARCVIAWAGIFGMVNFELFGQFQNVVEDRAALFDYSARSLGRLVGLTSPL